MKEFPKSVPEAVKRLFLELSDRDKFALKNTSEEDLAMFHLSLGNYIRNEFRLWGSNKELLRDCFPQNGEPHPDVASSVIIKSLVESPSTLGIIAEFTWPSQHKRLNGWHAPASFWCRVRQGFYPKLPINFPHYSPLLLW